MVPSCPAWAKESHEPLSIPEGLAGQSWCLWEYGGSRFLELAPTCHEEVLQSMHGVCLRSPALCRIGGGSSLALNSGGFLLRVQHDDSSQG